MQLHALFLRRVDDFDHLGAGHRVRPHDVFAVVLVVLDRAGHEQRHALFDAVGARALAHGLDQLERDRIRVVGDVDRVDLARAVARLLDLEVEHLAPDRDAPGLDRRLADRHRRLFRHVADQRPRRLEDDLRHQARALAHADAPLGGLLLHRGLVALDLLDDRGAHPFFLLDVQLLDHRLVAALELRLAGEFHGDRHAEPFEHGLADLPVGAALLKQVAAAVHERDDQLISLEHRRRIAERAVEARVQLAHALEHSGQTVGRPHLRRKARGNLHAHAGQHPVAQLPVQPAQRAVRRKTRKDCADPHSLFLTVDFNFLDLTGGQIFLHRKPGAVHQIAYCFQIQFPYRFRAFRFRPSGRGAAPPPALSG